MAWRASISCWCCSLGRLARSQGDFSMCYSAQIRHDYAKFVRTYGAIIDIAEFVRLYWNRGQGAKLKIPKAMDAAFADPQTEEERRIQALIAQYDREQASALEQE